MRIESRLKGPVSASHYPDVLPLHRDSEWLCANAVSFVYVRLSSKADGPSTALTTLTPNYIDQAGRLFAPLSKRLRIALGLGRTRRLGYYGLDAVGG